MKPKFSVTYLPFTISQEKAGGYIPLKRSKPRKKKTLDTRNRSLYIERETKEISSMISKDRPRRIIL